MTNSSPSPIDNATSRLIRALEALERNVDRIAVEQQRDVQQHQHLLGYQKENEALQKEQVGMKNKVAELEKQYEELQNVAGIIYSKLESSIKRLTEILEK